MAMSDEISLCAEDYQAICRIGEELERIANMMADDREVVVEAGVAERLAVEEVARDIFISMATARVSNPTFPPPALEDMALDAFSAAEAFLAVRAKRRSE